MATYKERVAALKKAGEETKGKHAEAKAKKKPGLFGKMKEKLKAKKVAKQKKAGGVKTGVQKAPKYKGAPEAPKTSKLGKQAKAKRKKLATDKSWTKAVKAQKKTGGPSMSNLIKRRNAAKKGSEAYAKAQNAINEAYGSKKVHKATKEPKSLPPKKREYTDEYGNKSSYAEGGKVEGCGEAGGGMFNWPSRDARNGGNK
tara:strand:- start:560 stop:1159 length:600 start_codon:yes stop_codon:yes gene_type:complete